MNKLSISVIFLFFLTFLSFGQNDRDTNAYELKVIEFQGNNSFSSPQLLSLLRSKESPVWFFKFLNSFSSLGAPIVYFDSLNISVDIRNITNFYISNGFFELKIDYAMTIDSSSKTSILTYKIIEGEPSRFKYIKVHGIDSYPQMYSWRLSKYFISDSLSVYSQNFLISNINDMLRLFRTDGYMQAKYDSALVVKDTILNNAAVDIFFTLGNYYKFDETIVMKDGDGSAEVSDELIKDLVAIEKNSVYNVDKITQSQVRLIRTGLFSNVRVYVQPDSLNTAKVPVRVQGSIVKINELAPELVFGNEQNAFRVGLAISYLRKNFFGDARKFTFKPSFAFQNILQINYSKLFDFFEWRDDRIYGTASINMLIDQPYIFGEPISGSLDFTALYYKLNTTSYYSYKGTLKFEFELPPYTFLNYLAPFYAVENVNQRERVDSNYAQRTISLTAGLGGSARSTHVDNLLFPTSGYNLNIYFEEGNSLTYAISEIFNLGYEGLAFYKGQLNAAYYYPLNEIKSWVLAIKGNCGYIQKYEGELKYLLYNKRLFAGGSNSLRGWATKSFPSDKDEDGASGGTFLLEGSFEIRNKFSEYLGWAFFVDWGNATFGYKNYLISEVAVSPGLGFRFYSPFAVFRLDFGFKGYDPAYSNSIFMRRLFDAMEIQFGIGEAF